ncbi:MAG TPA: MFS transporter, partial [Microlunatus sp.]|nr:MFS transporter [Microlunatus sp.]
MFRNSSRSGLILAAVAVVQFLVSLDLSVVNVGLPEIADGLGFTGVGLTWVIHAYALAFGGLLLLGGKAADRYGRRRMLLLGLAGFGLASLAGGFAQTPGQLIAARAVQGAGAAVLAPAALALLTATFPSGRARVRAFGVWSAMNAAGAALGVLIGGVLTEYAGWRWVMFVNVPMAAIALTLAWFGVGPGAERSGHTRPQGRPDVLGAVLGTAGMTALVLGIVRTEQVGWAAPQTLITLALAAVLLAGFVLVERSTRNDPLVRLGLLANRSVAGANTFNLLLGAAMASAFYFLSLYLQRVLQQGAAATGLAFLPLALAVVVGSTLAVGLGYRTAPRTLLIIGGVITGAGFAWFGSISADGSFLADVLGPSLVTGVGIGLCLAPVVSTSTAGVATEETGTAAGLLNSSRQLGAALGLAALGTAAQHRIGAAAQVLDGSAQVLNDGYGQVLNDGYALGLGLGAVLLAGAVLVAVLVLPRPDGPPRPDPATR